MLIVHLFVSYAHVNLCHFFSSSCCRGLAAASACGSSWIFPFTFLPLNRSRSTQGYNLNKLGGLVQPMLHTKFQGHRPFGSREEDCLMFLPGSSFE